MGNSIYLDELIVSYLSNELNEEEVAFVLAWINSSEENKRHFEELRNIWNLIGAKQTVNNLDVNVEWTQFKQATASKITQPVDEEEGDFKDEVYESTVRWKRLIYRMLVTTVAAASILFVIGFGWKLLDKNNKPGSTVAATVGKEVTIPISIVRNRINSTNRPINIDLPDGSQVKLYAKSRISYHEPFLGNRRDINLIGKAYFRVAKDKKRPFTVISGDLATTALGTQFTVTAFENANSIIVRLYEGKVVVKSSHHAKNKLKNDYYLMPGHELVYDVKRITAKIRNFKVENIVAKPTVKKEAPVMDNPSVPDFGSGTWYMFNNQPLNSVFDQLEQMFNVDIVYSKKDVSKIYFIGSFNLEDSLDDILKQIAVVNNLKVLKKNNKVIITK